MYLAEWWAVLVGLTLVFNGMLNSYVGCSPKMGEEGCKPTDKELCEEEVELKVELGKLENMDGDLEIKHEKENQEDVPAEAEAEC